MKSYLYFILALSFISCQNDKKEKAIFIDLTDDQYIDGNTNQHFKILDTIQLQESENSHIQKIHKISVSDNFIFILDKALKYVYQFNKKGKFKRQYTTFGDAPHQSININDFAIDSKNKYLYILSVNDRKILKFSFKGDFIKSQRLSFECYDIDFIKDNLLITKGAFYDEEGYNVKLYNFKDNNILKQFMPFPKDIFPVDFGFIMGGTSFQNNNYLLNNPLENILYTYNSFEKEFEPKYKLNFGDKQWPKEKQYDFKQFMRLLGQNKYSFISPYFFEDHNFLYIKYNVANSVKAVDFRYLFFDKLNHKKYVFKSEEQNQEIYQNTLLLENEIFYSYIKNRPKDIRTTDSIILESNPKIIKYQFNKH